MLHVSNLTCLYNHLSSCYINNAKVLHISATCNKTSGAIWFENLIKTSILNFKTLLQMFCTVFPSVKPLSLTIHSLFFVLPSNRFIVLSSFMSSICFQSGSERWRGENQKICRYAFYHLICIKPKKNDEFRWHLLLKLKSHTCNLQQADLRSRERPHFHTDPLPTGFARVASGSLSVCCVSMWKHCWFTAVKTQRQIRSFRLWQARSSCLCVCFQEASADLMPLEDEWNERRRIQMTSVGFKGKNKYLYVCHWGVCDLYFFFLTGGWVMWLSGSWNKPLNFSVQITAEQDALQVSFKRAASLTRKKSCDLRTCCLAERRATNPSYVWRKWQQIPLIVYLEIIKRIFAHEFKMI